MGDHTVTKPQVTIAIPCFNEGATIGKVVGDIRKTMQGSAYSYELLVIDDGSDDATSSEAKKAGAEVIIHPYNKGYGAALKTGARKASGDFVLYIDGDGQHYPKDILALLEKTKTFDMVVGARTSVMSTSVMRAPGKKILGALAEYLSEHRIPDLNSGFRVIRKERIMDYIHLLPNGFSFTTTITLSMFHDGYDIAYVDIDMKKRKGGRSTLRPLRDGFRFIMLLLRITMLFNPLKVLLPFAVTLFVAGAVYSGWGIATKLDIPESAIVLLLAGIMIFFFGLLADQLSNIRRERPGGMLHK